MIRSHRQSQHHYQVVKLLYCAKFESSQYEYPMCFHDCNIFAQIKQESDSNKLVRSKGKHKEFEHDSHYEVSFHRSTQANLALEEDIFDTQNASV